MVTSSTITREELGQKLLTAAERCADKGIDALDGHEASLQSQGAQGFVAAYEKLLAAGSLADLIQARRARA